MDFDLQQVKQYEMSSQLLVFGYGREIYADTPELILYTILVLYHQPESFEKFNGSDFYVDDTGRTITKNQKGQATAYGGIPMLCDLVNREVHQFELKVLQMGAYNALTIGIDEGRVNCDAAFALPSTHHYGLDERGKLWEKGKWVNMTFCCWSSLSL